MIWTIYLSALGLCDFMVFNFISLMGPLLLNNILYYSQDKDWQPGIF